MNWTFLIFLDFYEKKPCKKFFSQNCFDKQEKSWIYLKMFQKKTQKFQSHLSRFRSFRIFSVGQPWWPTFFRDEIPSQLLQCCYSSDKVRWSLSAATVIQEFWIWLTNQPMGCWKEIAVSKEEIEKWWEVSYRLCCIHVQSLQQRICHRINWYKSIKFLVYSPSWCIPPS